MPEIPLDPNRPLIVRSSALDEDGASHSLAGVYESIGGITTAAALKQAALDCLQSYHSPTAVAYRAQWQLPDSGMALLVQPQIAGTVLGVAFSRQPVDGSPRIIIEASDRGDPSVVSGAGIPVHLEIPVDTGPHLPDQDILPVAVLEELVALTQELEARFHGIPQDIEWIWDGHHLTLLQCRPITSLQPIWTRTIAAEVIPGAIRPLTWSINRPLTCGVWGELFTLVLEKSVQDLDFTQTATLLGSHAYFNATLLGVIFRQMGLPEQGLEFLLRGGKMGKPPRSAYGRLLKCLPGLWRLIQMERSLTRQFEQDQQEHFQPTLEVLEQVPPEQLTQAELWGMMGQIQELLKRATLYNILAPIGFAIRRSLFRISDSWLQDNTSPDSQALQAMQNLAQAVQHQANQTGIPVAEILRLDPFQEQFHHILETYGYLSEVGTDIAVPCWREQPELIEQMLLRFASGPNHKSGDPAALNFWQRWRRSQCQPRLDLKGKVATVYARLLAHLRWSILTLEKRWLAGGILAEGGDIFFLEQDQIETLALAKTPIPNSILDPIRASITDRKRQFEQDQIRSIPPVVYGSRLPTSPNPSVAASSHLLIGIPGSAGEVIGTIQVLKSLADAGSQPFQPTTILVVPYTDAGWSPLLATASGIISEVGGQLSHGAILAREYGIPAVMNVAGAMTTLTNGQRVRLDGGLGQVEILPLVEDSQG
ncbi:MAG: pyruvate phosphate dikinase PEP/pyruvate-binding protein [Synechococcaceae cyanobacterium SM2_3_2]|nr:pyruvate phosphate dikinase PEP/pyruvate-binding protein [Synechococcaceae cyanobacterium SM2_3_2]